MEYLFGPSLCHLFLDKHFSKRYENDGKSEEVEVKSVEKELANYVEGIGEPEPGECLVWTSVGLFSWLSSSHSSDFALDCHVVD